MNMTFHEKLVQLMRVAQDLAISFQLIEDGVIFSYEGDKELFTNRSVEGNHWHLAEDYEPWFFGSAREKARQQALLNDALVRLRSLFNSEERALLTEYAQTNRTL